MKNAGKMALGLIIPLVMLFLTMGAPANAATQKLLFAESNPVASNQNQIMFHYGKEQMCKLLGAKLISADANLSPAKQVADINTFIQQKVNGITSWTLDQGAATVVYQRAGNGGIPVVTENSPGQYVNTVFVQEENVTRKAQEDAARLIAGIYPGGQIIIVGGEPVPYILYVTRNMQIAAKQAGLKEVARQDNLTDQANGAHQIIQDLLIKYPNVKAIWCFNDRSALGVSAAVRALGKRVYDMAKPKEGGIIITGMNGTQEALDAVKAGALTATYGGQSVKVGAAEIELLDRVATGKMSVKDMPAVIVCPYERWDGSNINKVVAPLKINVTRGVLDQFIKYNTNPATIDDFLQFVKTM